MSKYDVEILESFSDEELMSEINDRDLKTDIGNFDSKSLINELENRDYWVFDHDASEIDLDEVDTSDMVAHLNILGYTVIEGNKMENIISDLSPMEMKDLLCDVVGVNHHTSKDEVLKLLSEKF